MADKFCVFWQGRKASSAGVRKHAVFERCYRSIDQALHATRTIARRRGSSALVKEKSGLTLTLMTCHKSRCRATHFGRKLGLHR